MEDHQEAEIEAEFEDEEKAEMEDNKVNMSSRAEFLETSGHPRQSSRAWPVAILLIIFRCRYYINV